MAHAAQSATREVPMILYNSLLKFRVLILTVSAMWLAAAPVLADPMSPGMSYLAVAQCNEGAYTFFETYDHSTSMNPRQGVVAVQGASGEPLMLFAVSNISGTPGTGIFFATLGFGTIILSPEGEGHLAREVCNQSGNTVRCGQETIELHCQYVPVVPSGFSAGN
jgi:hypothetical protein